MLPHHQCHAYACQLMPSCPPVLLQRHSGSASAIHVPIIIANVSLVPALQCRVTDIMLLPPRLPIMASNAFPPCYAVACCLNCFCCACAGHMDDVSPLLPCSVVLPELLHNHVPAQLHVQAQAPGHPPCGRRRHRRRGHPDLPRLLQVGPQLCSVHQPLRVLPGVGPGCFGSCTST